MIGCVITGPGEFAPGLSLAVEMSAGKQEKFEVVAFREDQPLELYESNLRQAIESLQQDTEGVIVFSDLLGGTPFRTAMVIASALDNVEVLTGSNLPMLIEIGLLRTFESDVKVLAAQAVNTGKEGIQNPQLAELSNQVEEVDTEGI